MFLYRNDHTIQEDNPMSSEKLNVIPRPEHPRPDFVRETFFNLNGVWQFAFDDKDEGLANGWMKPGFRHRPDR